MSSRKTSFKNKSKNSRGGRSAKSRKGARPTPVAGESKVLNYHYRRNPSKVHKAIFKHHSFNFLEKERKTFFSKIGYLQT